MWKNINIQIKHNVIKVTGPEIIIRMYKVLEWYPSNQTLDFI